jgi:PAS domain S-box-containing protein
LHYAFVVRNPEDAVLLAGEQFHALTNLVPGIVWTARSDGTADYANGQWYAFTGCAPEKPLGEAFLEALHPADQERVLARWTEAQSTGSEYRTELRLRDAHGNYRWFLSQATPLRDAAGRILQWFGLFTDITERKQAEEQLRESEARFRTMADGLPLIIWVHDADGRQEFVNRTFCEFFGITPEQAAGEGWQMLMHPGDAAPYLEEFLSCVRDRRPFHAEVRVCNAAGEWRNIESWGRPRFAASGEFLGFVGTSADITERRAAEEALRASENRARRQHAELELIYQHSPVGLCALDRDLRYMRINERLAEMNGIPAAAHLGRSIREVLPEWADALEPVFRRIIETGEPVTLVEVHGTTPREPGVERDWLASYAPVRDAGAAVLGIGCVVEEITERKRAEVALRVSEERFRGTFENAAIGMAHVGLDGRWLRVNRTLCQITGYSREELLAKTCGDITHPDDLEKDWALARRLIAGELPTYTMEKRYIRKDASLVWVELTVSLLRAADGEPLNFLAAVADISERKAAQEALREADLRKNVFLATLAHELRNPLAPIRNAVQILKLQRQPETPVQAAWDIIDRQVQHMVRLIDDLLDVSRITQGRLELRRERVDLAAVVEQAVEASRPHIERAGHELTVSLPPQPVYLDADPVRLSQVFLNLLNNACKYTEKGGHIWLTAERDVTDVVVKVRDTGIGIPPEHLPRVFDMFSQVESALERSQGGLGIGLALARGLVEIHGGGIEARSEGPGRGTELLVRLPVLTETPAPPPYQPESLNGRNSAARRILVVDDNRDSAESLADLLRLRGNEVETAYDGLAAVEAAERSRPDVVLLDLGMPKMDGFAVCRRIREQPWGKGMVLIAQTGWGSQEDRRRSEKAGFDAHLVKPVEYAALLKLLRGLQVKA